MLALVICQEGEVCAERQQTFTFGLLHLEMFYFLYSRIRNEDVPIGNLKL